jgi:hypothetical protein
MHDASLLSSCLRTQFPEFASSLGLTQVDERYDEEHFGNALLILENRQVRFRFVRDRGQLFADAAEPGNKGEWWDLRFVAELVGDSTLAKRERCAVTFGELVRAIEQNYSSIAGLFSPEHLPRTLLRLTDTCQLRHESRIGSG